ncbi:MAG: gamma-glutamylcyclotransferase [Cyanobacteria bacterium SZAS LIN-2]|nr:gamma-glutamylcyclotransferase [Cyanobacteria bacterium SZAS LIN-2]
MILQENHPRSEVIYNFSYGSNMYSARLRARTPSAVAVGSRNVPGVQLTWDKVSRKDGSRKCDAERTGNSADCIWGVLYEIDAIEEHLLDRAEGLGFGYSKTYVGLEGRTGLIRASMYVATEKSDYLPFDWYKVYVVAGAREHGLPRAYVLQLESVRAKADPDQNRADRHVEILQRSAT